jgi:thioredoxin reductase (NADPH)
LVKSPRPFYNDRVKIRSKIRNGRYKLNINLKSIAINVIRIQICFKPNTELFREQLDLDENGYIIINRLGQTTAASVFAAGDIANSISPTISAASGLGMMSAKAVYIKIWKILCYK